jgi:hypothetical protein
LAFYANRKIASPDDVTTFPAESKKQSALNPPSHPEFFPGTNETHEHTDFTVLNQSCSVHRAGSSQIEPEQW